MDSFFLMGARPLVEFSPSMKLHELLDWSAIAGQLTGLYASARSAAPVVPSLIRRWACSSSCCWVSGTVCPIPNWSRPCACAWTSWSSLVSNPRPVSCPMPAPTPLTNRLVKAELEQKLLALINSRLEQRAWYKARAGPSSIPPSSPALHARAASR